MSSFHRDQVLSRLRLLVLAPTMSRGLTMIRNQVYVGGLKKPSSLTSFVAAAVWHATCSLNGCARCRGEHRNMSRVKDLNRIPPVDPKSATGKTRQIFDDMQAKFGMVPNLFRVLGNAPAALEAYVDFSAALSGGAFDTKIQEQIGLTVADSNLCDYCLSAHMFIGNKVGLTREEITDAIRARAADPKTDAILKLARGIIVERGELTDSELQRARGADLTDGEIVEVVANVVLNIFMNYLDHVARTVVDFPEVNREP
jgi:AhpD family alkylhydroperoxidase